MVAATTPPAPSVRTVTSEEATKTAPMKPPAKYHQGTPLRPSRWVPPEASATTNRAAVPTMNEIVAAANVPTAPPSLELIGGCMATSIPAVAERGRAIPLVIARETGRRRRREAGRRRLREAGRRRSPDTGRRRCRPSLGRQPVVAHARVHAERRVELVRLRHLANDYLRGGLDLGQGRLEQQLVVDLQHESRRQPGLAQRSPGVHHRDLDYVRRRALNRRVHGEPLAQGARRPLARAQLRDPALAPEQRRHVAGRGGLLDR